LVRIWTWLSTYVLDTVTMDEGVVETVMVGPTDIVEDWILVVAPGNDSVVGGRDIVAGGVVVGSDEVGTGVIVGESVDVKVGVGVEIDIGGAVVAAGVEFVVVRLRTVVGKGGNIVVLEVVNWRCFRRIV
jgi:hypothetical protein